MSHHRPGSSRRQRQWAGTWQTSIRVPISPSRRLLPSFYSDLIARSYSLFFHVSFGGMYATKLDLETPLQVAYPRLPTLLSHVNDGPSLQAEEGGVEDRDHRGSVPVCLRANVGSTTVSPTLSSIGVDTGTTEDLPTYDELMS